MIITKIMMTRTSGGPPALLAIPTPTKEERCLPREKVKQDLKSFSTITLSPPLSNVNASREGGTKSHIFVDNNIAITIVNVIVLPKSPFPAISWKIRSPLTTSFDPGLSWITLYRDNTYFNSLFFSEKGWRQVMSQSREQKEYLSLSYDLAQFQKLQ